MPNRIVRLRLADRRLSPVEAEILVFADAENLSSDTELRGRLTGPSCPYATTIEVAYPLRKLPQPLPGMPLARRIVIPEPSFWDPTSPFLYRGVVELWEGEDLHERLSVRHGLRSAVLRPDGLRWNGQRLTLHVAPDEEIEPAQVPELKAQGFNAALLNWPDPALLEAAERLGLILIGKPTTPEGDIPESAAIFGWLMPHDWRERESEWLDWLRRQRGPVGQYFDDQPIPEGVSFLIGGPAGPWLRLLPGDDGELGRIG